MKRTLIILAIIVTFLGGCEKIYTPDIELREGVLVVDARIVNGQTNNVVKVYKSLGFNVNEGGYPRISGAKVELVDNDDNAISLQEIDEGEFWINFYIDEAKQYKLRINYHGDLYESEFEGIPELPEYDSLYGFAENKILLPGGESDVNSIIERPGVMLYTDILNEETKYYRFSARKTYQYVYYIPDPIFGELAVFSWKTIFPRNTFNVAAPPDYSASKSIVKHPLFFMEQRAGVVSGQPFVGWILFLHQYSISENAYKFYKDVNSQLYSEGKLFDPLYIQANNNLKCVSNPDKLVLGNFEISSHRETRYYVRFISDDDGYLIKPIPYFYNIPLEGERIEETPDFWETPSRTYPDE